MEDESASDFITAIRGIRERSAFTLLTWLANDLDARKVYARAIGIMGVAHTSFSADSSGHINNTYWDAHVVRHALGIRDPLVWLHAVKNLELLHMSSIVWTGYDPSADMHCADIDDFPLEDWGSRDISMYGICWLYEYIGSHKPIQNCDECDDGVQYGIGEA